MSLLFHAFVPVCAKNHFTPHTEKFLRIFKELFFKKSLEWGLGQRPNQSFCRFQGAYSRLSGATVQAYSRPSTEKRIVIFPSGADEKVRSSTVSPPREAV